MNIIVQSVMSSKLLYGYFVYSTAVSYKPDPPSSFLVLALMITIAMGIKVSLGKTRKGWSETPLFKLIEVFFWGIVGIVVVGMSWALLTNLSF